jgi:beta-galactosidase
VTIINGLIFSQPISGKFIKENGDNPAEYVKELQRLAKSEDPSRVTVAASNMSGDLNKITDIIAWNKYFGWYG